MQSDYDAATAECAPFRTDAYRLLASSCGTRTAVKMCRCRDPLHEGTVESRLSAAEAQRLRIHGRFPRPQVDRTDVGMCLTRLRQALEHGRFADRDTGGFALPSGEIGVRNPAEVGAGPPLPLGALGHRQLANFVDRGSAS
jgi:hypothetical protein